MASGKWRPFCLGLNVLKIPITSRLYTICDKQSEASAENISNKLLVCAHPVDNVVTKMSAWRETHRHGFNLFKVRAQTTRETTSEINPHMTQ